MATDHKIDVKIVDVSVAVSTQTTPAGFDLLAHFTLLVCSATIWMRSARQSG